MYEDSDEQKLLERALARQRRFSIPHIKSHPLPYPGAVAARKVTTLNHEPWYDAVEGGALVSEPAFAGGERLEVVHRARHLVTVQTDHHLADVFPWASRSIHTSSSHSNTQA